MSEIFQITSFVTSIIAILGVLTAGFYWKGVIDTQIKRVLTLPEVVSDLKMKMDVIWKLFVEQLLDGKPNLAQRGSGFKLTEEGEKAMEDIAHVIEEIRKERPNLEASDVLVIVSQKIGMAELNKIAHKNGHSTREYLAMLTIKLGIEI